jgi:hypothetical protein
MCQGLAAGFPERGSFEAVRPLALLWTLRRHVVWPHRHV